MMAVLCLDTGQLLSAQPHIIHRALGKVLVDILGLHQLVDHREFIRDICFQVWCELAFKVVNDLDPLGNLKTPKLFEVLIIPKLAIIRVITGEPAG
jgi:hypothetical protein